MRADDPTGCGWQRLLLTGLILLTMMARGDSVGRDALADWLALQAGVDGWHARVTQTRTLEALNEPLESVGRVWFQRPNRFRWELGDPPRSIAVRQERQLVVHYPRLERTERYALDGGDTPEQQALALLELGFPEDAQAFLDRYELLEARRRGALWDFRLRPTSAAARRLVTGLHLEVDPGSPIPRATELTFADGSTLRNDFHERRLGAIEDGDLFRIDD